MHTLSSRNTSWACPPPDWSRAIHRADRLIVMLFPQELHGPIRSGAVTVAFRRWRRPTVAEGGTLQTPAGLLQIDELTPIDPAEITADAARSAGFTSIGDVVASLHGGEGRRLYRVRFHRIGDDPRVALRSSVDLTDDEVGEIVAQLARWDSASRTGPWTDRLLRLISARPATVSHVLADGLGTDRARLKRQVRQLKQLGLTESLETGYRVSPRGEAFLRLTAD